MADSAVSLQEAPPDGRRQRRLMLLVLAAAVSVLGASVVVRDPWLTLALAALAALMALPAGWIALRQRLVGRAAEREARMAAAMIETDFSPAVLTDASGGVLARNALAGETFGVSPGRPLAEALERRLASPAAHLRRMRSDAEAGGRAVQDIVGSAQPLRIAVRRLSRRGPFLWRLEDVVPAGEAEGGEAAALPAFVLDADGTRILHVNGALAALLEGPANRLDQLIADPPLRPGEVHVLRTADGTATMRLLPQPQPTGETRYHLIPAEPGLAAWSQFDALPVPILKLSPHGEVLAANRPARGLLGTEALVGAALPDLVEGLGRPVEEWLLDIAEGRSVTRPEVVRASRPRQEVYLQITVRPMRDAAGPALLAVLSDATELKTLEAQFVQSQKMQAIGQLAGGVAHDFNNLLTAISGHCDLLLLRRDSSDPDYSDLTQINQNANRAAALVGQLLAFSRKQTLQPETLDLRDTLADMAHLLNRLVGEKTTLTLNHDSDLRAIRGDKRQLEQVLMNLVVNARDAMPEGGEIVIETAMRRLAEPLKRDRATVPPGDYVVVSVRDRGHGIAADKLPKIFEPFFTTKRTGEGTGLGLSTAYGIVKQSGGFIFADSVPGEGTCFSLYFPAYDPAVSQPDATPAAAGPGTRAAAAPAPRTDDAVVLLVEDEAPVRTFAARALRMRGHTVLEADCAEAALALLEDPEMKVDIFVTDVVMPGLDGPSWVARALESRPGVRVIFVSGYAEDAVTRERIRIPNSVFLPKPFSLAQLTRTVQDQLQA